MQNSPAGRVPSHGSDVMATTYAIDLVPVDAQGRTAVERDWRTRLSAEPPERFLGFGAPVLAPLDGTVVQVHDDEPDHYARRGQLPLLLYMLGQAGRLRRGAAGLAGNHVVLELAQGNGYVALAHLRRGSICVEPGDVITVGQQLGSCGNSGNSTEPHIHLQVMDQADPMVARGLPMAFSRFHEHRGGTDRVTECDLPAEGSIIESADEPREQTSHATQA